ncbi:hypothetical protein GGTG_07777 [Gaeumannomyces tritici R3-111a-1]|uniref:Uncharacterized protein n=1 Tax=Gaeumannomyces tritici (strain R3-111a-1) TaxID=644352 RepID=J3P2N1_GAET3|nr:hypothetical protein GGTG_07777 [Gaeumannomyces tritici R3-111a-1]EJT73923.1 hypothetical protein GGTG_07777 [Gaeumannomyces tritici R3-111a-1]
MLDQNNLNPSFAHLACSALPKQRPKTRPAKHTHDVQPHTPLPAPHDTSPVHDPIPVSVWARADSHPDLGLWSRSHSPSPGAARSSSASTRRHREASSPSPSPSVVSTGAG